MLNPEASETVDLAATGDGAAAGPDEPEILLSLIVPCYNVAPYLGDFFRALQRQGKPDPRIELILVNDGATDSTLDELTAWSKKLAYPTVVLDKPNGGPSSARNLGLEHARGEWVSFPDPDDVLAPGYLRTVKKFLRSEAARTVDLVATNILYLDDATGALRDEHPLRGRFTGARRIAKLSEQPDAIHLSGATAIIRRQPVVEQGLAFDERVRPNFEDAAFIAHYLLTVPDPTVAMLRDAHYHYRRRTDGSSLTQSSWARSEKYTDLIRFGHLETLLAAKARHGQVPVWLQNVVLYDLFWYFISDARTHSPTAAIATDVIDEFFGLVDEVLSHIDPATIRAYRASWVPRQVRKTVLRMREPEQPLQRIHVWQVDREQRLASIKYYWAGNEPDVVLFLDGAPVRPVFDKARAVVYFGRTLMWERIAWIPAHGRLTATVEGEAVPVVRGAPRDESYAVALSGRGNRRPPQTTPPRRGAKRRASRRPRRGPSVRRTLARARRAVALRRRLALVRTWVEGRREKAFDAWVLRIARTAWARKKFGDAWILVDRDIQAHDNAEHLYRYLRDHEPDVNAWFALGKDSPDWRRLAADGFRLLPYRSWRHMVALLHCTELISSQVDNYVIRPYADRPYPAPRWRFTFLQHGVTKDDLSRWVNPKRPSLVLSVTQDEHESFVGDDTPYVWTEREVALTGFPRHDTLRAKALELPDRERDLVVLMPTWRRYLLGDQVDGGNLRELLPGFWESEFIRSWLGLAGSPEVRAAAEAQGYRIVFFPHPNLQEYITADKVPAGVEVMRYSDVDIQDVLARARVVVTDFSSLAFDAAFIDRPVVYFQFDADTFFDGSHAYRRGYFDYETQGFGPVCYDIAEAADAVTAIVDRGGELEPTYADRIERTFAFRDGRASERAVREIRNRRLRYDQWVSALPERTPPARPGSHVGGQHRGASLAPTVPPRTNRVDPGALE